MLRCFPSVILCVLLLAARLPPACWALPEQSSGCMFDQIEKRRGPLPVAVAKDIPREHSGGTWQAYTVSKGDAWRLMRIRTSMQPFRPDSVSCSQGTHGPNVKNVLGQDVPCMKSHEVRRHAEYLAGEVLERAIKLHTDRLLVRPFSGNIVVPAFTPDNFCSFFQIPEEHLTTGFSDYDMMLYVALTPLVDTGILSMAAPCAENADGRPVVGGFVFDPRYIALDRDSVRIAAHDIAHALGFSYRNMHAKKMTKTDRTQARGKKRVIHVESPNVKAAAAAHYGCASIEGMELENGEFKGTGRRNTEMLSHWERRNAKDELMAYPMPHRAQLFLGLYTALTLSAFEDLGYYKARYDMAEPMAWGHNAGCDFLSYNCDKKDGDEEEGKESKFPAMFCTEKTKENYVCTADRQGIGKCTLSDHFNRILPALDRSEFGASVIGGDGRSNGRTTKRDPFLTDFCPVVSLMKACNDDYYESHTWLESLRGAQAWCLDGDSLKETEGSRVKYIHAVCAEIRCENKTVTVRFKGQRDHVQCPEGKSIPATLGNNKITGSVKCPRYEEVCTVNADGKSLVTPNDGKVPDWKQSKESPTTETAKAISKARDDPAGTEDSDVDE